MNKKDYDNVLKADIPFDKKKQIFARKPKPFYIGNPINSRSQQISFCTKCGDTSFELLDNGEPTGKCCRCGVKYASS